MQIRVSAKGKIMLPGPLRRRLGIRAGDPLDVRIEGQRMILTVRSRRRPPARIVADPVTGLPVLSAGTNAPILRSEDVDEILANFPGTT
jgi:AbrB family looped-hinge helix DNA binding protein